MALPKLRFLHQDSVANTQGLGSLPRARLERKLGALPQGTMEALREALRYALDLEASPGSDAPSS